MPRWVLWLVLTAGAILVIADAAWRHAQVRAAEAEPASLSPATPMLPEGHPELPGADQPESTSGNDVPAPEGRP